jgi:hypothetical protein
MSSSSLTHDQARQYLLDGRDQLGHVEREALHAHLANCTACQAYNHELASLQSTLTRTLQTRWGRTRPANDSMLRLKLRITARTRAQRMWGTISSLASVAALAAVIVLAVFVLNNVNQTTPAALPPGQPFTSRAVTQSVTRTSGSLTFPIAIGDRIRLIGFDLVSDQLVPGSAIDFTLRWQTQYIMADGYMVFVNVVDAQGNVVAQLDAAPTDGVRPMQSWRPGETIIDRHVLMLPITAAPGQYTLLIGLNDRGVREPTSLGGNAVPAATLHVSEIPNRLDVNLDKFAALLGYALETSEIKPGAYLAVTLYWQARANTLKSYQSFVYLMPVGDASAVPIVMSDSVPGGGTRPTPTWNWGETIPDQHLLRLPTDLRPGQYNLIAGLYDTKTGARLNTPVGDSTITVTLLTVK